MTEFAIALAWLAVQVTLVAGLALLLDALLAKHCPRAAARLLTAAALLPALLTAVAFVPTPTWWTVSASDSPAPATETPAEVMAAESNPGVLWLPRVRLPKAPEMQPAYPPVGKMVAGVWLCGVSVSTILLLLGLVQVARLRRRSRPVNDPALIELTRSLANEYGIRGEVELREADVSGLPATVGWRRPLVLLPAGWRDWSAADRRAVLAHELAHVRHGDYLTALLALAARALHFYHPLAQLLTARLRLRQELAADALAAPAAGGPDIYLRALARLALRSDGRPTERPAALVLAARGGDLFRRIQMLRTREEARPLSRLARRSLAATLVAVAALSSTLRGPAQTKSTPAGELTAGDVQPFDLTYLSPDVTPQTHGVFAFRPNVLFAQPGMEPLPGIIGVALKPQLAEMKGKSPDDLAVADIEQVVGDLHLDTNGTGKPGSRSLMLGMSSLMIRTRKDVDWEKTVRGLFPDMTIVERGGRKYYEIKATFLGPVPLVFCAADARTLVAVGGLTPKEKVPELRLGGKPRDLGPAWKRLERCAMAIAIDNHDGHFTKKFAIDVKQFQPMKALLEATNYEAVGVDFRDGVTGTLYLDGRDGKVLRESFPAVCDLVKQEMKNDKDAKPTASEKAWLELTRELLADGTVTIEGTQLKATGHSTVRVGDLIGASHVEVSESK
ncbi:MAG: M56 family metallopeptidase [Gemmataceae bacterium]